MATALDLMNQAARLAKVKGRSQALSGADKTEYLDLLNQMLDSWKAEGLDLGLGTLAAGDTVYIDDSDLLAVRYSLATLIAESVGKDMSLTVQQRAILLKDMLQSKYFIQPQLEQPELFQNHVYNNIEAG